MNQGEPTYETLMAAGAAAYHDLQLDPAATAYAQALALRPDDFAARLGLVRTLTRQRRRTEAYAEAERLVALAPERPEGYTALGTLHFLTDRYDEAQAALERAIALAPDDPEPYLTLAQVRADRGEYDVARSALDTARRHIASIPSDDERVQMEAFALHVETYLYLAEGRGEEAAEAAQRVVGMQDANPHAASLAFSNLGILAVRARNLPEAVGYLERAYAMNPYFHRAGGLLGRILYVQGQPQRAAEVLGQVVESLDEPEPTTRYAYGLALARVGRAPEARAQFRAALGEGLRGVDRLFALWQMAWLSPVGRVAIIGGLLALIGAWLYFGRPDPQSLTLAGLFLLFFAVQRFMRSRRR